MTVYKGIDVSKWQRKIDWTKVKTDFAFIRVGVCNPDGTLVEDSYFKVNMTGAIKAGIPVGVYVYSYAANKAAAKIAAAAVLDAVKPYRVEMPLVFDFEDKRYCSTSKRAANTEIIKTALEVWEKAGYYAMWYTYKSFALSYVDTSKLAKYDFWLAHYTDKTDYKKPFGIWQHSSKGKVDGIEGNVDLNFAYANYPEIIRKKGLNRLNKIDILFNDLTEGEAATIREYADKQKIDYTVHDGRKFA